MLVSMGGEQAMEQAQQGGSVSTLTRPVFTLREASKRCGVSFSTIRRRREDGAFPNAYKTPDGQWVIPVEDLLAAGLKPTAEPAQGQPRSGQLAEQAQDAHQAAQAASSADQDRIEQLERDLARARAQIEVEQAHRAAAEQIAAERGRSLDDLRTAIRLLEPPHPSPTSTPDPSMRPKSNAVQDHVAPAKPTGSVKRWLARGRRAHP